MKVNQNTNWICNVFLSLNSLYHIYMHSFFFPLPLSHTCTLSLASAFAKFTELFSSSFPQPFSPLFGFVRYPMRWIYTWMSSCRTCFIYLAVLPSIYKHIKRKRYHWHTFLIAIKSFNGFPLQICMGLSMCNTNYILSHVYRYISCYVF